MSHTTFHLEVDDHKPLDSNRGTITFIIVKESKILGSAGEFGSFFWFLNESRNVFLSKHVNEQLILSLTKNFSTLVEKKTHTNEQETLEHGLI